MRKKRLLAAVMAAVMVVGMTACGNSDDDFASDSTESAANSYDDVSSDVYNAQMGDFYESYQIAKEEDNVSTRYAEFAVAEAKLLEDAVFLPTTSDGGSYGISRVAPYTVDYTLWGDDMYRYHQALVTEDLIKTDDRVEMKEKWKELRGTGKYADWAEDFLKEKGYTLKDSYTYNYTADPTTWDGLSSSNTVDGEAVVNTYDGLMEYDEEGTLQPALAESYEVSDDGLTYTFHIRKGVKWVDSQGREIGDVTADDFVAGFQHMMDAQGGLEYLVKGVISGTDSYISGEVTDMADVGVKAEDDYTLVYSLNKETPYFMTMLGYAVFAPMNRSYYESQGGKFGSDYDSSASDYAYGTDSDHIAYCGPYVVTNATEKNTIVFKANESYWNKDNINVKTITWTYNDGSDPTKSYNDAKSGDIDASTLTNSTLKIAKEDGIFDKYAFVSSTDATTYQLYFNLNRSAFANTNDETTVVSEQTDEDKSRTNAALSNVHFRRALCYAFDRASYNAQYTGEDVKTNSLRNTFTPGNFVSLDEDVTIDINGKETTFKKGTYYGEIVQAQLDSDEMPIKVWDAEANDGVGSSDGFDGWYSTENAKEELAAAIKELKEDGVEIDADHPITLDFPYLTSDEIYSNRGNTVKQSLESAFDGEVQINLIACTDEDQWLYAGYYGDSGKDMNYDMYDCSGWGPDYGDPDTYLSVFQPDYSGYMTTLLGIY